MGLLMEKIIGAHKSHERVESQLSDISDSSVAGGGGADKSS